jgi:hypothetical protein
MTAMMILDFVVKGSTLVGGAFAVWTFWRTAKVRRAEWLSSLHSRFFESDRYKTIREILDYQREPEFSQLRRVIASGEPDKLAEDFADYLNFFEFVASLKSLGQVKLQEISMLFQYYLELLCKHDFVRAFIRQEGFERLDKLLSDCVHLQKTK